MKNDKKTEIIDTGRLFVANCSQINSQIFAAFCGKSTEMGK